MESCTDHRDLRLLLPLYDQSHPLSPHPLATISLFSGSLILALQKCHKRTPTVCDLVKLALSATRHGAFKSPLCCRARP